MRRVLYVEGNSATAGLMAAIFFIIVATLLYVAGHLQVLTGTSVLLIIALGWVLASPVFLWRRARNLSKTDFLRRNEGYLSQHWQYSKWVLLTAFVFQLTSQGYFWLVALFLDTKSVGALRAAWNVVQPAIVVFTSISFVMLPRLVTLSQKTTAEPSATPREILRYLSAVMVVALVFAGFVWQFGALAYRLIYAGRYGASVGLLYVAALLPLAGGIANVFSDALRAMEKPGLVFYAYIVGGILTLAIGVPAIIFYGIRGAAWGMVASNAGFALTLALGYKWLRIRRARSLTRLA